MKIIAKIIKIYKNTVTFVVMIVDTIYLLHI